MLIDMKRSLRERSVYLDEEDRLLVEKAIVFAERAHHGQRRMTGEAYVIHPYHVCEIVMEYGADVTTICAALLHDVVEDTDYTLSDIRQLFGDDVSLVVEGVTKITKGTFSKEERAAVNANKLLCTATEDIRVLLVKIADRLHNMRTLGIKKIEKRIPYANETLLFFAPLAKRLGLIKWQKELEELGFYYINQKKYEALQTIIDQYGVIMKRVVGVLVEEKVLDDEGISEWTVRKRSIYEAYSLLQEHACLRNVYEIEVITHTILECYQLLGKFHRLHAPVEGMFKDEIANPTSLFCSQLMTTVLVGEVLVTICIKTKDEKKREEKGAFAYFEKGKGDLGIQQLTNAIIPAVSLYPIQTELQDVLAFELFQTQVIVFTKSLTPISLPKGATAIDYAFYLQPDHAKKMTGVLINEVKKPIYTVLQDMDVVEVISEEHETIHEKWLTYSQTSQALQHIHAHFQVN
ncbi:HD domain-containing protein [Priestia koreensis]|uniref:HD domain-containing protein n=1 Tax=Priestia koreensis TaxID=284581 RepID=UPI003D029B1E